MAMLHWVMFGLFCGLFVKAVPGETVPCISTSAECLKTGFASISIINNHYRCCAPGYSMSVINTRCFCSRTAEAMNCTSGPTACRNAASVTSDGQGNTLCCPMGYSLNSHMTSVNGLTSRSCTCTRSMFGSGSTFVVGPSLGMVGFNNNNNNGNINGTGAVAQQVQQWRQAFQSAMTHGMGQMSRTMQTMGRHMHAMGNAMNNFFTSFFRG